jgi:DNA modification methylase
MKFIREPDPYLQLSPKESTVFQGDAAAVLTQLPDSFFQCAMTSPPYWGLRD